MNPNDKARRVRKGIVDKSIPTAPATYDLTTLPAALPPAKPVKEVQAKSETPPRRKRTQYPVEELPLDCLLDRIEGHAETLHLVRDAPRMVAHSQRVIAEARAEITRRLLAASA